jgi:hypothetical protein
MAWTVVPCLDALRDQLDLLAPGRDKSSDGSIGDTAHSARPSSHNPDRTGSPEYRDGDTADEIRARDFDKDLRTENLSMLMVVRHLVEGGRSGRFWWIRYVIYQGVIYHKSYKFAARTYTGVNHHDEHAHVNSDFSQAADTVRGVAYHFEEIPVAMTTADWSKLQSMLTTTVRAEVAKVAGQVWTYQLEDPTSKTTPKATKSAGAYQRYADVIANGVVERVSDEIDDLDAKAGN